MEPKENIIPAEVRAGEKNLFKRIIKRNKRLHRFFYSFLRCNKFIFLLRNYPLDTNKLFKSVEIETTSICNRKCPFCPVAYDKVRKKEMMPDETFNKIITELKELNFKNKIAFSGYSEPLLDKRLEKMVRMIKKELGSFVEIVTNGDFLTYEKFKRLISAGVDVFRLSQHDNEPSEAIKLLFSNIQKDELKYIIYQTTTEDSITLTNRGGSVPMKTLHPFYCSPMHLIIRADGSVPLCCNDYYKEINFGNVNRNRLIDIWNSPFYKRIRNEIKRGIFNLEICKKCLGIPPFKDESKS